MNVRKKKPIHYARRKNKEGEVRVITAHIIYVHVLGGGNEEIVPLKLSPSLHTPFTLPQSIRQGKLAVKLFFLFFSFMSILAKFLSNLFIYMKIRSAAKIGGMLRSTGGVN